MQTEAVIRLTAFVAVLSAVALWELTAARRRPLYARGARWPHNLGLLLVDVALVRLLARGAVIGVALAGGRARLGPPQCCAAAMVG